MSNENKNTPEAGQSAGLSVAASSAAFERWWHDEGSGFPPLDGEDRETHMHRVAKIAWSNGAYLERSAIVGTIHALAIVRGLNSKIALYESAIKDALMHLDTNYCIDGLPMKDSDAANSLRRVLPNAQYQP